MEYKNEIKNQTYDEERALYNICDTRLENIKIDGPLDGESAFKEARRISVKDSYFNLRYPFWHTHDFEIDNIEMTETCRASLWYSENGIITNSKMHGLKAVRECSNITLKNCDIVSLEFGWKSKDIVLEDSFIDSQYLFLEARNVRCKNINQKGKYTFQYLHNCLIEDSILDTKDAFWHSKNVTVINSTVKGEYLGWYSDHLTLINCKITGTQPLCYANNLKLINCTMEGCDKAFEYSSVSASIVGNMESIKNPRKGKITLTGNAQVIHDHTVVKCNAKVILGVEK